MRASGSKSDPHPSVAFLEAGTVPGAITRSAAAECTDRWARIAGDRTRRRRFNCGSHLTQRWRSQSRANPSLKPNTLLAGKIQGISFVGAFECDYWLGI